MENILIPTDFSACAGNAADVGIALAELFGANIHFFSSLDIRKDWEFLSEEQKQNYPEDLQQIHNAELLLAEWVEKADERNLTNTSNWSGGKLIKDITKHIEANHIDFIVMGSHGISGKSEYFIGSNTHKVVRIVDCPVLVIKEPLKKFEFKNVVFASDFDPKEEKPFKYLLDFLKPFSPMIHLLEVNTYGWFSQPYALAKELMNDFAKMCPPLKFKKYFYRDYSVDAGIRHFSDEVDADLIVISNYTKHPLRRVFQGSSVEAVINHAERPVLCIDLSNQSI